MAFPLSVLRKQGVLFAIVAFLLGMAMISWEVSQTDRIDAVDREQEQNLDDEGAAPASSR